MKTFFSGLNDSFTLLAFRFKAAPTAAKIGGLIFVVLAFFAVNMSLQASGFIRRIMTTSLPDNPTAETARELQNFLSIYLNWYVTGEMDIFVAVAVALLLGSIIFVPFSGYVIHGMVSHSEMIIIKSGDNYKIGDSILFQVISSFTLIQIIGLTVAAQLITFDSPEPAFAIAFVWGVWVFMTLLTTFFSWVVEYVNRKFGSLTRLLFLGLFILSIAAFLLFDPNHGGTLFGAAPHINEFLNTLASGDVNLLVTSLAIILGLSVTAIYGITLMSTHTLQIPEPLTISISDEKQIKGSTLPLKPGLMLAKLLFRYNTVTKPVITAVAFAAVIVVILGGQNALTTTLIVLPLAVGVSFGGNIFGLISGAVNWLFTIKDFRRKMFFAGTIVTFVGILLAYIIVYGIGLIFNSVTVENIAAVLPGITAVTFSTTLTSIYLSVRKPLPFSGKSRENLISSPTTLIGYVMVFLFAAGFVGNITLLVPNTAAWVVAGATVLITGMLYYNLYRKWMYTEKYTSRILKETINAG